MANKSKILNHNVDKLMKEAGATALTFDDVTLLTQYADFLPSETSLETSLTRNIKLNIPFASAAMDTVTEAKMAIAMALLGGIGVIHRGLTPETQAVLPRLKTDFVDLCLATINGKLNSINLKWDPRPAVCVVLASGGYPGKYHKHLPISGVKSAEENPDVIVFHSGTDNSHGELVTNGGRVLGVTALGNDLPDAIETAYEAVEKIHFDQMHFRWDIGAKALK